MSSHCLIVLIIIFIYFWGGYLPYNIRFTMSVQQLTQQRIEGRGGKEDDSIVCSICTCNVGIYVALIRCAQCLKCLLNNSFKCLNHLPQKPMQFWPVSYNEPVIHTGFGWKKLQGVCYLFSLVCGKLIHVFGANFHLVQTLILRPFLALCWLARACKK